MYCNKFRMRLQPRSRPENGTARQKGLRKKRWSKQARTTPPTDQHLVRVEEWFANRVDKLTKRVDEDDYVTEYFDKGRLCALKEHKYLKTDKNLFGERSMHFYDHARFVFGSAGLWWIHGAAVAASGMSGKVIFE